MKAKTLPPTHAEKAADAGARLSEQLISYMHILGVPDGLKALGYTERDIPALVEGTLPQKRVLNLAPKFSGADEISQLFRESMKAY